MGHVICADIYEGHACGAYMRGMLYVGHICEDNRVGEYVRRCIWDMCWECMRSICAGMHECGLPAGYACKMAG